MDAPLLSHFGDAAESGLPLLDYEPRILLAQTVTEHPASLAVSPGCVPFVEVRPSSPLLVDVLLLRCAFAEWCRPMVLSDWPVSHCL